MSDDPFLDLALTEAQAGQAEGGIPIGSVLVIEGRVVGRGHNRRVQQKSAILHAEMDCLERAGRLSAPDYRRATLYSTLSPCDMCSGAILLYGIPHVVVGENRTFQGPEGYLRSRGVRLEVVQDARCERLLADFVHAHPELWNEDIGVVTGAPPAPRKVGEARAMAQKDIYAEVPALPVPFNLCEYFLERNLTEGRGDKVALISGDERRTYTEVSQAASRVAAALRRRGVRPEERVLIVLPDRFEFAETWFGVLRAGAVFAMVSPLLKRKDFDYYLAYTKARVAVVAADCLSEFGPAAADAEWLEHTLVVGAGPAAMASYVTALEAEDPASPLARMAETGPDDLAGWLFTSGSTGEPKACVHTHSDFAYNTETYALRVAGYRESDICLSVPKLFFGYATGTNLMFPFRVGATSILFEGRATADELFDQIAAHRPTFLTNVPTMINNMLNSKRCAEVDLSCLRISLSAGEALPPALYSAWKERVGVEILDGIGSAEMFHIYISNWPGDVKPGSLGRIVPGYEAQIVGPDDEVLSVGQPGRLRVRGGSTALCYWADKAKSRETFQGEWCTSADVFRRDAEGYYFYEGRSDDLIKVSGIWTSPLEIENAMLEHPAVAEVCVLGKEDADGLVKPLAFVVTAESYAGNDELGVTLKAHLKARLAPHKYPRWFEWRDELPKNDRGKVARKILKGQLGS